MNQINKRRFYFPLFRLIVLLRGGDARRAESNGFEAVLVGSSIFLIHYVFFATRFIPPEATLWITALLVVALAFWIWLFWLLLIYINWLIIKLLHACGLLRAISIRRAQSILWVIVTTVMACALLGGGPLPHEFAALWLVAVVMNLVSAGILALYAARNPAK